MYLAVLPFYRDECVRVVHEATAGSVIFFAGERHVDETVRTGIDPSYFTRVRNIVIRRRLLLQVGQWRRALAIPTLVVDLNPRSINAWVFLVVRKLLGRRTLVWGHLYPRAGAASKTAAIRRRMRSVSQGTILYGYDSVLPAKADLPDQPVWVAPNSLYRRNRMLAGTGTGPLDAFVYVGRLESSKKVDVLISAFASSGLKAAGVNLRIVGVGSQREYLEGLAAKLGVADSTFFLGQISTPEELREVYNSAICSVSPGYAGLSITQSLGFGVPVVVSRDEPHAPEIELVKFGEVEFFDTDDHYSLASALRSARDRSSRDGRQELSDRVASSYSAEAMASGILCALDGVEQTLGKDGWPC
ncbi:glycosyltransferase [Rhodococcus wratislaviensis IFP 2016]|nr:glycosyltransferase [Rhodococcus wratislaviensis IFP 2016]